MATAALPTRDDFAAMLEGSLGKNQSFEGRVVKGRVTAIENDLAVIDVAPEGFLVEEMVDGIGRDELQARTGAKLAFAQDCQTLRVPTLPETAV